MIDVKGVKIAERQSLITFKGILSDPGALPKGILVIMCLTSSSITSLIINWSLRGIVLGTKGTRFWSHLKLSVNV